MKNLFTSIFIGITIILSSCSIQNPGFHSNRNIKSGKCYAQLFFPDVYNETNEIYPVYTGGNPEKAEFVQKMDFITQQKTQKWKKKKIDNCISTNPNDCFVYCKIDVPETKESYYIVTDTTKTKDYELKPIHQITNIKKKGYQDWVEVVCESDATSKLYKDIAFKLITLNYLSPDANLSMRSKDIHKALNKFAKDNGLPYGNLNIIVLEKLGVL